MAVQPDAAADQAEKSRQNPTPGDGNEPLIRPPRLRTDVADRSASRLELFFDLAYVLVVAELAASFAKDLSWAGAATFAGLLTITWWSWVTVTLYANRFDTNDVIYRIVKLAGTGAAIAMAASAQDAIGDRSTAFTLSYLATRLLLLGLYARAYRHVAEARPTIRIYLAGTAAAAALWAASLMAPDHVRYAMWAAGILVEVAAPILATRYGGGVPLHLDHLPERFGLLVILVLGESVASIVIGVHDTKWTGSSVLVAAICFVSVAALWWTYFDLGGAVGKRRLVDDGDDQESGIADAYIFGHLPVVLGLVTTAVGIEQFILHPGDDLSPAARWALHGGTVLFLLGTAAVMAGTSGRWRAAWPWPTLAIPFVAGIGAVGVLPAAGAVGLTAMVLVTTVLLGIRAQRRGALQTTEV